MSFTSIFEVYKPEPNQQTSQYSVPAGPNWVMAALNFAAGTKEHVSWLRGPMNALFPYKFINHKGARCVCEKEPYEPNRHVERESCSL